MSIRSNYDCTANTRYTCEKYLFNLIHIFLLNYLICFVISQEASMFTFLTGAIKSLNNSVDVCCVILNSILGKEENVLSAVPEEKPAHTYFALCVSEICLQIAKQ